jgi:hypothetical protein
VNIANCDQPLSGGLREDRRRIRAQKRGTTERDSYQQRPAPMRHGALMIT